MASTDPRTPTPVKSSSRARESGFLDRLFSLFAGDDPERRRQRQLREIAAELKRNRARLYNPAQLTAEPGMARFFWELYRTFAAAQVLVKAAEASGALKLALIELSLSEEQSLLRDRLTERSIDDRAKKGADPAALEAEVRRDVKAFLESVDTDWMNAVDAVFNRVLVLLDLVGFDYFFLLRKFDPALPERDFSAAPRFASLDASAVVEDLQDFLEILPGVDPEADWDQVLAVLKEHRGMEVVSRDALHKSLQALREAQRSGVLLLVVRHLLQDPGWKPMVKTHRERIVEPYLAKLKVEADTTVAKVAKSRYTQQMEELARAVFGTGTVSRLSNYSEDSNQEYAQNMLGGFLHVSALSYLREFLVGYLPRTIREVIDLLVVKGRWAKPGPSQQVSEAFHQLLALAERVSAFDTELAEDGARGRKLRTIAMRADRDRRALVQLRAQLQQVNDEAHAMIGDAVQHFVSVARILKLVHEDIGKPNPEALVNWKELRPTGDRDFRGLIAAVYRKIYNFVQLMQMYR